MTRKRGTLYQIVVRSRPGELAKLTQSLSEAGINVKSLRVATLGDKASIQFALSGEPSSPSIGRTSWRIPASSPGGRG